MNGVIESAAKPPDPGGRGAARSARPGSAGPASSSTARARSCARSRQESRSRSCSHAHRSASATTAGPSSQAAAARPDRRDGDRRAGLREACLRRTGPTASSPSRGLHPWSWRGWSHRTTRSSWSWRGSRSRATSARLRELPTAPARTRSWSRSATRPLQPERDPGERRDDLHVPLAGHRGRDVRVAGWRTASGSSRRGWMAPFRWRMPICGGPWRSSSAARRRA